MSQRGPELADSRRFDRARHRSTHLSPRGGERHERCSAAAGGESAAVGAAGEFAAAQRIVEDLRKVEEWALARGMWDGEGRAHGWQLTEARRKMSRQGGAREAGEGGEAKGGGGGGGLVLSECGRARGGLTSTSRISPLKNGSRPQCDRPT